MLFQKFIFIYLFTYLSIYLFIYLFWHCGPMWAIVSSFMRFLDHTQWCTTLGRTPLDEWSAHRRDFYLTTHTRDRHQCPQQDSNPQSQQASGNRPMP